MPATDSHQQQLLSLIRLEKGQRATVLGGTGAGKSTLLEALLPQFQRDYPTARVLVIDSKPRFRAAWELSGLSAKGNYRKWGKGYGGFLPDSWRLPLQEPRSELRQVWQRGGHVAVAQVNKLHELPRLEWAIDQFFEDGSADIPRLVVVDEAADFWGSAGIARRGDAILHVARTGRERNVALLAGSQRPRGLPKSLLTEMSSLYLFHLDFADDVKHLTDMGLPKDTAPPMQDHVFLYWNKKLRDRPPSGKLYKLAAPGASK